MARNTRSSFWLGLSALFYLGLLFAPLALVGKVNAESEQEVLQDNYGTGKSFPSKQFWLRGLCASAPRTSATQRFGIEG